MQLVELDVSRNGKNTLQYNIIPNKVKIYYYYNTPICYILHFITVCIFCYASVRTNFSQFSKTALNLANEAHGQISEVDATNKHKKMVCFNLNFPSCLRRLEHSFSHISEVSPVTEQAAHSKLRYVKSYKQCCFCLTITTWCLKQQQIKCIAFKFATWITWLQINATIFAFSSAPFLLFFVGFHFST